MSRIQNALIMTVAGLLLAVSSPASATHKANHGNSHGNSWISDIQPSDDSNTGYEGPAPLTVVDSTGTTVGLVSKLNMGTQGDSVNIGVRLDDGRTVNITAYKRNFLMGDVLRLFSESEDCSEPLYAQLGSSEVVGPNNRITARSGIANGMLYVEAENPVYETRILYSSWWSVADSTCRVQARKYRVSDAMQMFPAKAMDYLPPFKVK